VVPRFTLRRTPIRLRAGVPGRPLSGDGVGLGDTGLPCGVVVGR